jgi:hypothetical protein
MLRHASVHLLIVLTLLSAISGPLLISSGAQDETGTAAPPTRAEVKLVTLPSGTILRSKALAELARQTGIRVEDLHDVADVSLRLDVKRLPFWQAVDAIAAASGARVNLFPTSGRIILDKRGPNFRLPPICYDGRFRLSVKKVTANRDLELDESSPRRGSTNLTLEVAWDPELYPLYLETRPHGLRLVDDRNKVQTLPDEGSSLAPVDGRIAVGIDLTLPAFPRSVQQIRSLEGELSVIGPSKMLTFHFDGLDRIARASANDPERIRTRENVTCRILRVTLDRDRWSVRVALDYPAGLKQLDSNQSWVVNNEMALESSDGKKRVANPDYVLESASPRQAILWYHFRNKEVIARSKPSDWKLSYRTPASLIEAPIKFAFKDIPLP